MTPEDFCRIGSAYDTDPLEGNEGMRVRHVLTIPDQTEAMGIINARETSGSDGQGQLLTDLSKTPVAIQELHKRPRGNRMDAIHLSQYRPTNFVQWYGRRGDGMYYPFGLIMEVVKVSP